MDTRTGEIKMIPAGQPVPPSHIELGNMPNPRCGACHGKGKLGPKIVGHKHKRRYVYIPCPCTNPKVKADASTLRAIGAFGELRQEIPAVAMVGAESSESSAARHAMEHRPELPVIFP